jgi:hypothetical protein
MRHNNLDEYDDPGNSERRSDGLYPQSESLRDDLKILFGVPEYSEDEKLQYRYSGKSV